MRRSLCRLATLALAALLASAPASSRIADSVIDAPRQPALARLHPLQSECSERQGPFATQDSAWANLHQAESQGYGVSGVFPCYDSAGYRGYCFNVFYSC